MEQEKQFKIKEKLEDRFNVKFRIEDLSDNLQEHDRKGEWQIDFRPDTERGVEFKLGQLTCAKFEGDDPRWFYSTNDLYEAYRNWMEEEYNKDISSETGFKTSLGRLASRNEIKTIEKSGNKRWKVSQDNSVTEDQSEVGTEEGEKPSDTNLDGLGQLSELLKGAVTDGTISVEINIDLD